MCIKKDLELKLLVTKTMVTAITMYNIAIEGYSYITNYDGDKLFNYIKNNDKDMAELMALKEAVKEELDYIKFPKAYEEVLREALNIIEHTISLHGDIIKAFDLRASNGC